MATRSRGAAGEDGRQLVRLLLYTIAAGLWGLGVNIALQKGWLDRFPNGGVAALFIIPVLIFLCLAATHEKARSYHHLIRKHRFMSFVLFVVVGAILAALTWFTIYKLPVQQIEKRRQLPEPVLTAQLQELKQLQDFIGGKDEGELWALFDLPNITYFNLKRAKGSLNALSAPEAAQVNEFFKDGTAILDSRYCKVDRTAGGFHYEEVPGKLGTLNLSSKFISSRQTLAKFQASPQLPATVRNAVKELDSAVYSNAQMLLDVINDELAKHPNNVLLEDDGTSPMFGAVSGAFLDKRIWLKPKQEAVISAIEAYLNDQ